MVMVALLSFGALMFQVAEPSNWVLLPSTATVLPTKASACVDCALFWILISVASWSFCLNCCSTPANCTSCAVNWLVSSGSSGFWFRSCVVSSVRKVWKLFAIPMFALEEVWLLLEPLLVAGAETTGVGIVASSAMASSLNPDVDAAARGKHAAVAARHRGRDGVVLGHDQALRVRIGLTAVLAR